MLPYQAGEQQLASQAATLREGWTSELKRHKEAWALGEKSRREAWQASKMREIKEMTIKARPCKALRFCLCKAAGFDHDGAPICKKAIYSFAEEDVKHNVVTSCVSFGVLPDEA